MEIEGNCERERVKGIFQYLPCMRNNNIIKWRVALAKASETNFEDHCTVFAGWRNACG